MKKPKKTVRVERLRALLAQWDEREKFCRVEADHYPKGGASGAHRAWEARAGGIWRCSGELRELLEN